MILISTINISIYVRFQALNACVLVQKYLQMLPEDARSVMYTSDINVPIRHRKGPNINTDLTLILTITLFLIVTLRPLG